jgi:hypothetical protein
MYVWITGCQETSLMSGIDYSYIFLIYHVPSTIYHAIIHLQSVDFREELINILETRCGAFPTSQSDSTWISIKIAVIFLCRTDSRQTNLHVIIEFHDKVCDNGSPNRKRPEPKNHDGDPP